MERKKQYQNKKTQQNLYQYEMGIELGADVEANKQKFEHEYEKTHGSNACRKDQMNHQSQKSQNR